MAKIHIHVNKKSKDAVSIKKPAYLGTKFELNAEQLRDLEKINKSIQRAKDYANRLKLLDPNNFRIVDLSNAEVQIMGIVDCGKDISNFGTSLYKK